MLAEWEEGELSVGGRGEAQNREKAVVVGQEITVVLEMVPGEGSRGGHTGVGNRGGGNTRNERMEGKGSTRRAGIWNWSIQ